MTFIIIVCTYWKSKVFMYVFGCGCHKFDKFNELHSSVVGGCKGLIEVGTLRYGQDTPSQLKDGGEIVVWKHWCVLRLRCIEHLDQGIDHM